MGLGIRPGKTKIFSNQSSNIRKESEVDDIKVETREESTKHLGQMITFPKQESTEILNRATADWTTFHKYKQELTPRTSMLGHRLRLFDAVVSPMNYACGAWTLTKEQEIMILNDATQRKILRLIMQTKRRYKKIVKQRDETKENHDTQDLSSTEDENGDGQSRHPQRPRQQHLIQKRYR